MAQLSSCWAWWRCSRSSTAGTTPWPRHWSLFPKPWPPRRWVPKGGALANTATERSEQSATRMGCRALRSLPAQGNDMHAALGAGKREFAFLHGGLQLHVARGQGGEGGRHLGGQAPGLELV